MEGSRAVESFNENQFISVYVYFSGREAEKGLKEFEDKTAGASLEAHGNNQMANVLLFYVTGNASKDYDGGIAGYEMTRLFDPKKET
ncbi:hypothetical protein [Paenibacillus sp. GYB003]|uniref:hypothetical protein n=1 Tax=Paenibacillus sp. GYB003 TaxID=2994392 RepID=UPI002F964F96